MLEGRIWRGWNNVFFFSFFFLAIFLGDVLMLLEHAMTEADDIG
jgi:hypothetical protein